MIPFAPSTSLFAKLPSRISEERHSWAAKHEGHWSPSSATYDHAALGKLPPLSKSFFLKCGAETMQQPRLRTLSAATSRNLASSGLTNRGLCFSKNKKSGGNSCWLGSGARRCCQKLGFFPGVHRTVPRMLAFVCVWLPSQWLHCWSTSHHNGVQAERKGGGGPAPFLPPLDRKRQLSGTPELLLCQGDPHREAEPTYPDTRTKPGFCDQKEGPCRFLTVFKSEKFHVICLTQQTSTTKELNFQLLLEPNSSDKLHFPQWDHLR